MLNDSVARLVISDAAGISTIEPVLASTPSVEKTLQLGDGLEPDLKVWQELAEAKPIKQPVALSPNDTAVIGYTSGTTGRSKGAMLSHGNFTSNSLAVTKAWHWREEDHLLLVLPLFHMHGLAVGLHGTLMRGSTISLRRKFEFKDVFNTLLEGKVSMFFGVPTMYQRLLAEAQTRTERPQSLRLLVSGSAPLSPQTHAEVKQEFGLRILERYGMTETLMNLGNPYKGKRKAGSVGLPFEGVKVRIAQPETGKVLATGGTGELQLRGPNICKGYWQQPEASAKVWTADGWFKTGDLAYCDQDGYYYLNGRAKELIISGGFNVYPREVEELLEQHPGVKEVAVLGLADADLGEQVTAVVVTQNTTLSKAELQDYCKEHLADFKKPREVYFVSSLPRNALGKVQKHLLREQLVDGQINGV